MIAVIGDFDPRKPTHEATTDALAALLPRGSFGWIDTDSIDRRRDEIRRADGFLVAPGSPYRDEDAVVDVIRHAREEGVPLVGT